MHTCSKYKEKFWVRMEDIFPSFTCRNYSASLQSEIFPSHLCWLLLLCDTLCCVHLSCVLMMFLIFMGSEFKMLKAISGKLFAWEDYFKL